MQHKVNKSLFEHDFNQFRGNTDDSVCNGETSLS